MTNFAKRAEMDEIVEELEAAAREEGTETGECWRGLCHMWRVIHYGSSDEFRDALEKELREQHQFFKENFTWVEHDELACDKCGRGRSRYRELVWNEEL